MLSKNWKGNSTGSWSSIFFKDLLLLLTVFINYVKETAFVILCMHVLVCSGSGRGLREKLGCNECSRFCFVFLLLSPVINKKPP